MSMFEWLEGTAVALWVGESLWAYPFLLSLHVVGLATIVGVMVMLDLRILGMFKGLRVESFLGVMKLAWFGFALNAVSGLFLFSSQASFFVTSTPFLLKIGMIFAGVVSAAIMQQKLRSVRGSGDVAIAESPGSKALAVFSLATWFGAIVTGRLIAYF